MPSPTASDRSRRTPRERRQRRLVLLVAAIAALALVAGLTVGSLLPRDDDGAAGPPPAPTTEPPPTTETPVEPTTGPEEDAEASPDGPLTAIPDDFPLVLEVPDADVERPSRDLDGASVEICGEQLWPEQARVDRLATVASAPERVEVRELTTFSDADIAVAVLDRVRSTVAGCASSGGGSGEAGDVVVTPLETETGDDAVTVGLTQGSGQPGGTVHQMVRVGNAILVATSDGELTASSLDGVAEQLAEQGRTTTDAMCVFTEAGC